MAKIIGALVLLGVYLLGAVSSCNEIYPVILVGILIIAAAKIKVLGFAVSVAAFLVLLFKTKLGMYGEGIMPGNFDEPISTIYTYWKYAILFLVSHINWIFPLIAVRMVWFEYRPAVRLVKGQFKAEEGYAKIAEENMDKIKKESGGDIEIGRAYGGTIPDETSKIMSYQESRYEYWHNELRTSVRRQADLRAKQDAYKFWFIGVCVALLICIVQLR